MSTPFLKKQEIKRAWHVVDAQGQRLGRLAVKVARLLMGKDKPFFSPFTDTGDHVIVVNAAKVAVSGKKERDKVYRHHTGYLGGLKEARVEEVRKKHPERLVEEAVKGMLPKSRLGRAQLKKMKVYAGADHPHQAQRPKPLDLSAGR